MTIWMLVLALAVPILIWLLMQVIRSLQTSRRSFSMTDEAEPTTVGTRTADSAPKPSPASDQDFDALDGVGDAFKDWKPRRGDESSAATQSDKSEKPPRVDFSGGSLGLPSPPAEAAITDVHVSTTSPAAVRPRDRFFVYVFFHIDGFEIEAPDDQIVDQDVASLPVATGTRLTVRVEPLDKGTFVIDQDQDSCIWRPPSRRLDFRLRALKDLDDGLYDLRLELWCGEVQLDRWYLAVEVSATAPVQRRGRPKARRRLPRSAFASYSHRDKARVADRVEALQAVGIDVFLDSLDIRQGADWQDTLERELLSRDRTLLFWSTAASESEWVEKEWRYALEHRGLENILPNALEPPDQCPAPNELAKRPFGSVLTELRQGWEN